MFYCGKLKNLLKYGFKKYTFENENYYYYDNESKDIDIIIDKNKNIKISTSDQVYDDLPEILFKLYDDGLIKLGEKSNKQIKNEEFKVDMAGKEEVFMILQFKDKFYKTKMLLKTFYYKSHKFFIKGNIKTGYIIGDVLTGCILDYKINHINVLYHLKEDNPLDKFIQSIILNSSQYKKEIYRLKEVEII